MLNMPEKEPQIFKPEKLEKPLIDPETGQQITKTELKDKRKKQNEDPESWREQK
jgi:hypothetical protein